MASLCSGLLCRQLPDTLSTLLWNTTGDGRRSVSALYLANVPSRTLEYSHTSVIHHRRVNDGYLALAHLYRAE